MHFDRRWWGLCVAMLAGCPSPEPSVATGAPPSAPVHAPEASVSAVASSPADEAFAALAARFLEGWLKHSPTRATEAGDHRFDGAWPDVSDAGEASLRAFVASVREELKAIARDQLSAHNRIDAAVLDNQLELMVFAIDELRPAERDPLFYTALIGDGLDPLVTRDFSTLAARAKNVRSRLAGVPALVAQAKRRLKRPAKVHTETAIEQNKGLVELCDRGLADFAASAPEHKAEIEANAKNAAAALRDFQTFLEKDLLARSDGDFRLGRARFEQKLRLVLDDPLDAASQAKEARAFLTRTQVEMVATVRELWPEIGAGKPWSEPASEAERKAVVRAALARVADDRSTNVTIVKDAQDTLRAATAFVKQHDLVRVPEEPCRIIEMPEYRRGVSVAYCDAAGPLEPEPQTFYAISPTPKDWSQKRVDSYFREYNRSMLHDLTVHEAMPGHFLQLMHNNAFPSKLRAVFSHGAFVEGWAVYTEWLMAKYGYGGPRVKLQRQKMALRMSANAVLDFEVHAGAMTEKEALALMMDEAFQEEGEAVGKWRRARLTSAQLTTYYYGFSAMMKLRAAHEGKPGFTERSYHDRLLSFGSPAPRHVAGLMSAR